MRYKYHHFLLILFLLILFSANLAADDSHLTEVTKIIDGQTVSDAEVLKKGRLDIDQMKDLDKTVRHTALELIDAAILVVENAPQNSSQITGVILNQINVNISLTENLKTLAQKEALLSKKIEDIKSQSEEISQEFSLAKERIDNLTPTGAVGLALREQKQFLPTSKQFQQNSLERQRWMAEIQEFQIDLDRKHRDMADIDVAVEKTIDTMAGLSKEQNKSLSPKIKRLLESRQKLIVGLQAGYRHYFKSLRNLEYLEQQLILRSEEFGAFLDKHLLWIRSSQPIGISDIGKLAKEFKWLLQFPNLKNLFKDVQFSLKSRPVSWLMGIILMIVFLVGRKKTGPMWRNLADRVNHTASDSLLWTFQGFLLLAYESLVGAFLLGFVSVQLSGPGSAEITQSVATGLFSAAELTFLIMFFYGFCRNSGLAQAHFKWDESARKIIRKNLSWLGPLLIVLDFVIETTSAMNVFQFGNATAKLGLIAQGVAMALFCTFIFRFSGGIITSMLIKQPQSLLTRTRYAWYPLSIAIPLSNVLLVFFGYYRSAMELRNLISQTIVLFIGLLILHDLAIRELRLAHRKYIIRDREEKQRTSAGTPGPSGGAFSVAAISPEPEIDMDDINTQSRALLGMTILILALIGLLAIWKEPSRAFGILQDVHLWTYNDVVNGIMTTVPITLANLLMAMILAGATYMASRNLPGLLEIILFNRLSMDSGARYAFITLCRYTIVAIGVLLVINTIGFNWSKLQWLIAALGVGLGFGLQEIVANFISGLIVLFERPFRIGDTITIGDTTGRVSRIKIRSTTVVDWDRRELIVPNKEFITGKLINWSLSDPIVRIIVPVGIAYGSDTKLAETLLLKAAGENSLVLGQPAPVALFKGFGDNSLNFELRVFINGIDAWVPMLHQLNLSVDQAFRKAGVTISFPQRDVHLDTSKPLELRVLSSHTDGNSEPSTP